MVEKQNPIVIIGASYVRGWKLEEISGAPVVNKGVDGEQTFEMLNRFNRDVISLSPRAVVIWGYINDIFRLETSSILEKLDASKKNLARMVSIALEHRIQPLLVTEITIREKRGFREAAAAFIGEITGKESYQAYVNKHVKSVNQWIRTYAVKNNIEYLDFEETLKDETGARKKDYAEADGSHISPRGYERLTGYVQAHVELFTKSLDCFVADVPSKANDKSS